MAKIDIGYVQGIHGLRGDLKIKSKFSRNSLVFQKGFKIYLNEEEHVITSCKFYKGFYLVNIDDKRDINLVEEYKGFEVYIEREDLNIPEDDYLKEDLPGMTVVSEKGKSFGQVKSVLNNGIYDLLEVDYISKLIIPMVEKYIHHIDTEKGQVVCTDIEELIL